MTPIGYPDFGQNPTTNPTSPSWDSGEDTTRILMGGGSLARSGRWIFADGFEGGTTNPYTFTYFSTDLPITSALTIQTDNSWQGNNSLKISVGKNLNDNTDFYKPVLLPSSRYGFEFMFARWEGDPYNNCELSIRFVGYGKGTNRDKLRQGGIVFVETGAVGSSDWNLYYESAPGQPRVLIANVKKQMYAQGNKAWHYFKFVFDFDQNKAVRLFFDDLSFTLDANGKESNSSSAAITEAHINATNKDTAGTTRQSWLIDNLIITADEP